MADEARFRWRPHSRRCRALRGQRVVLVQEQRHGREYVYGAGAAVEGLAEFQFLPPASLEQDVTCPRHFAGPDHLEEALAQALRPFWETPARAWSLVHHRLRSQASGRI